MELMCTYSETATGRYKADGRVIIIVMMQVDRGVYAVG